MGHLSSEVDRFDAPTQTLHVYPSLSFYGFVLDRYKGRMLSTRMNIYEHTYLHEYATHLGTTFQERECLSQLTRKSPRQAST